MWCADLQGLSYVVVAVVVGVYLIVNVRGWGGW